MMSHVMHTNESRHVYVVHCNTHCNNETLQHPLQQRDTATHTVMHTNESRHVYVVQGGEDP